MILIVCAIVCLNTFFSIKVKLSSDIFCPDRAKNVIKNCTGPFYNFFHTNAVIALFFNEKPHCYYFCINSLVKYVKQQKLYSKYTIYYVYVIVKILNTGVRNGL